MKKIILFRDYRDQFYFSTKHRGASVDVDSLGKHLSVHGFELVVRNFSDIDFRTESFRGEHVLYQSSEDPLLLYKDYIQDVLLALDMQGAILIPSPYHFRAHHNKVFMEILRDMVVSQEAGNIISKGYGTYEEYLRDFARYKDGSFVLKPDSGTRSRGVSLMKTLKDKAALPFRVSRSFTMHNFKWAISKLFTGKGYVRQSNNRKKFIVQNFIPDLGGDYRVIAYGEKYYVLYRKVRENDFRASGSGKLNFDIQLPDGLLDFAKKLYQKFNTPYVSLDIGCKDGKFYLFEFQFMCLGQYAVEKSEWCYMLKDGAWEKVAEKPDLEREIAASVASFISSGAGR